MNIRSRIALLAAAAVAVAIVAAAGVAYAVTRGQLRGEIDASLRRFAMQGVGTRIVRSDEPFQRRLDDRASLPVQPPGELAIAIQFLSSDGDVLAFPDQTVQLPVDAQDVAVARSEGKPLLRDVDVGTQHLRLITAPARIVTNGAFEESIGAIQVARSLGEVDATLRGLAIVLFFVALGGVGLAAGLGLLVARSALRPVGKLTEAAETVARTQDLDAPIAVDRPDEIGRLAASFNEMLRALKESRTQQQQLVTDASHELRTPLTSLRTNIEVLARNEEMDRSERSRVLADLNAEMEELSHLVSELVDLATAPGATDESESDVRLDEVGGDVVERARRRSGQRIDYEAKPCIVRGRPSQIERAASNVVDNACKWNTNGHPIEVTVSGGRFEVRDHGPGIDPDDAPYVFDRFYRAPSARALPGSGLGLAIVKQVVEAHGGRVWAQHADGGGAIVGFEL